MGASKIPGMSKGKKYKNSQSKARPRMCSLYSISHIGRFKIFKTQDNKQYYFDRAGSLRRVKGTLTQADVTKLGHGVK